MLRKIAVHIVFALSGSLLGYLVFHPFAMIVYFFTNPSGDNLYFHHLKELYDVALITFKPMMLPMSLSFAFFGGSMGLLVGIAFSRSRRLMAAHHAVEKKKIAIETLQRLMVTLSHYLLNANTIIGGMAKRCKRAESDNDICISADIIQEQANKIDHVISALRRVTEIKTADYTSGGHDLMLDISKEMEELLNETAVDPVSRDKHI